MQLLTCFGTFQTLLAINNIIYIKLLYLHIHIQFSIIEKVIYSH